MRQHTDNYCNQWQEYEFGACDAYYDYSEYEYEDEDGYSYSTIEWHYFLDMYDLYCFWVYRPEEKGLQSIDLYDLLSILSSKLFTQISLEIQDLTDARFIDRLFLH